MKPSQAYWLVKGLRKKDSRIQRTLQTAGGYAAIGIGAILALILMATVALGGYAYVQITSGLPSLDHIPEMLDPLNGIYLTPTRLYDRSGQILITALENPGTERKYTYLDPLDEDYFSPQFIEITTSLTDAEFWQHSGYDLKNITNLSAMTIPERLVEDILLSKEEPGLVRSLRMRLLAAQLVAQYGRRQVLEWYLNTASYGHMIYGAGNAAHFYLGKSPSELNLAESALLAAVSEMPALNPFDTPQAAFERQKENLDKLLIKGVIGREEYLAAVQTRITLGESPAEPANLAPVFTKSVLDQLYQEFGREQVERGGLEVTTTMDYTLQQQVDCTLALSLQRLTGEEESNNPDAQTCEGGKLLSTRLAEKTDLPDELLASALVMDPENGQVLALNEDIGLGTEPALSFPKQQGSLLAPFAALAGFARGMSPATLVWDVPSSMPQALSGLVNPDGESHGPVRLRTALANDYLVPIAQLMKLIGAVNVWRTAETFGLTNLAEESQPEQLLFGGGNASLLETAQAYSVFANQGVQAGIEIPPQDNLSPVLIRRVEDANGNLLKDYENDTQKRSILSPELAYLVNHVLSDATARWPSMGYPNALDVGLPSGAKLGQTARQDQVWTVGYTPRRLVLTWLGVPQEVSASLPVQAAADLYHALIQYTSRDLPYADWQKPEGVVPLAVCSPSGLLPTEACENVVDEVFLQSNIPTQTDNLYQTLQINRETQRLATVFTPPELVEEKTFLVVPRQEAEWARQAGLSQPPVDYDTIQPPALNPDAQITKPGLFDSVHGKVIMRGTAGGEGFTSYTLQVGQGLNPQTWQNLATPAERPVRKAVLGTWDTQGLEGLYAIRLIVLRQNQQADTAVIQVTVDNTPPLVQTSYPSDGGVYEPYGRGFINLIAEVQDGVGIQNVSWYLDDTFIGERNQLPYLLPWQAQPGRHTLTVRATDLAGNVGESQEISFRVP